MAAYGRPHGVLITLPPATPKRQTPVLLARLADLNPNYFALVMATGIVAVALDSVGATLVARLLSGLDLIAFALLALLFGARLVLYPRRSLADLFDHARGPGYFTWVAGSAVLGTQLLLLGGGLDGRLQLAKGLWLLALALWLIVTYAFFAAVTLRRVKPPLSDAISGAWLLAVVATQGVSLLAANLWAHGNWGGSDLLFLSLSFFLVGTILYLLVITLIFYRFSFVPIDAAQLSPPYWINMGALAITTLAGTTLITQSGQVPFLDAVHPFLFGFTLLFWAFGTWWIPLLAAFGAWRHVVARYPLRYAPEYWGLVFPMGMYSVASHRLGEVVGLPLLQHVAWAFAYLGLAAWFVTLLGMLGSWFRQRVPRDA